jgi:RNA polymerase subunit RPABC4/transcription elongation factor Spt4
MAGEHKYYCRNCDSQIKPTDTVCPKCGKKLSEVGRRIVVTVAERITISDSVETSLIINPIPAIEKSLKEQDHFRAATFLAAILEYYGRLAIIGKLETEKRKVDEHKIGRFSLKAVSVFLYGLNIIDQPCYSALIELNKLRNNLLHIKDAVEFRKRRGNETEATIRRAMKCIDVLVK